MAQLVTSYREIKLSHSDLLLIREALYRCGQSLDEHFTESAVEPIKKRLNELEDVFTLRGPEE